MRRIAPAIVMAVGMAIVVVTGSMAVADQPDPEDVPEQVAEPNATQARSVGRFDTTYNGSDGMAVWVEWRNGQADIYGRQISFHGGFSTPALLIAGGPGNQVFPSVVWVGDAYFVVWQHARADGTFDVRGVRVTSYVDPVGASVPVASLAGVNELNPDIATTDLGALVVFERSTAKSREIWGRRIASDGSLVGAAFAIGAGPGVRRDASVAGAPHGYFVAWTMQDAGGDRDIIGSRVTKAGVVRDPRGIPIAAGPKPEIKAAVGVESGRYVTAWEQIETGQSDVRVAAISLAGSVTFSTSVAVGTADQGEPAVTSGPESSVIAWEHTAGLTGLRVAYLEGRRLTAPASHVLNGEVSRTLPVLAGHPAAPVLMWRDDRSGTLEAYLTVVTTEGPDAPSGKIVTALNPIESWMSLAADRRSVLVEFSSPIRAATFTAADLLIASADTGEAIGAITPLGLSTYNVEITGSVLDGGDAVSLVDGTPSDGLAEIQGLDPLVKVLPSSITVESPTNFGARVSGEPGSATAFVVFFAPVAPTSVDVEDFAVTSPSSALTVENVAVVGGTGDTTFAVTISGPLAAGDEIELVDGLPADGLAEVENALGGKAFLDAHTVVGGDPMTATIDARHGDTEFFVTFSDAVAELRGNAFATSGPLVTFAEVVPETGARTYRVHLLGPLGPGDVVSVIDGNPPDGRAEVVNANGNKTVPTSVIVARDEIAPTATLRAGQGWSFVVEFSEPITPAVRDFNIPSRFVLARGTGATTPAYSAGSPPFATCRALICVISYSFGTALVPGNTITIPAGAFSDRAGNPIGTITATVELDDAPPQVTSAAFVRGGDWIDVALSELVLDYHPFGSLVVDIDGDLATLEDQIRLSPDTMAIRQMSRQLGRAGIPGVSKLFVAGRIADLSENDLDRSTVITIDG